MENAPNDPAVQVDSATPRRVVMVTYPGIQLLDVVGPLEVLAGATEAAEQRGAGARGYLLSLFGPEPGTVRASSGLQVGIDRAYEDLPDEIDTLIVAGGIGVAEAVRDPRVRDCVRLAAARARRVCSVCTGAFLLAVEGLLDGRRATTHWSAVGELAERFPEIAVDPDSIYVRDGEFWTSAGVTAGMDLALALIEDDLDRSIALEVSRRMVFFLKRPGGQSQFSAQLAGQFADRDPLRDLQAWVVEHPGMAHTVPALAARVAMSPRHFSRVFSEQVGHSPARYVERVRVEAARRRLEESAGTVDEVAGEVGFGTSETMRRAFLRQIGVGPSAYRERFIGV
jgi:transcriptional regulator GlxA family with amidase domain